MTNNAKIFAESIGNGKKIRKPPKEDLKKGAIVYVIALALLVYVVGVLVNFGKTSKLSFGFHLYAFTSSAGNMMFVIFVIAISALFFYALFVGESDDLIEMNGVKYKRSGPYGNSHELSYRELPDAFGLHDSVLETKDIILGIKDKKWLSVDINATTNKNIAICGPQGSGKSVWLQSYIFQCAKRGESIMVNDSKGELYRDNLYYLKKQGYEVYQWNVIPEARIHSDAWNLMNEFLGNDDLSVERVDQLTEAMVVITGGDKEEKFYHDLAVSLWSSAIHYARTEIPHCTIGDVYNLFTMNTKDELKAKITALPSSHPAQISFKGFSDIKSDSIQDSAYMGIRSRFHFLSSEICQQMLGNDGIHINDLADKKVAVFVINNDSSNPYMPMLTLFFKTAFSKLFTYAMGNGLGKCKVPVNILLDEFPTVGTIDDFKHRLALARSLNIAVVLIFQNIPQMQNRFPNGEWEEYLAGCSYKVCLGVGDNTTADWFSKLSGTTGIEVNTVKKDYKTIRMTDYTPGYAESTGYGKKPALMPDDLLAIGQGVYDGDDEKTDFCYIFVTGGYDGFLKVGKPKYYKMPECAKMRKIPYSHLTPLWRVGDDYTTDKVTGDEIIDVDALIEDAEKTDTYVVTDPYGQEIVESRVVLHESIRSSVEKELKAMIKKYKVEGRFPNGDAFFDADGHEVEEEVFEDIPKKTLKSMKEQKIASVTEEDEETIHEAKEEENALKEQMEELLKQQREFMERQKEQQEFMQQQKAELEKLKEEKASLEKELREKESHKEEKDKSKEDTPPAKQEENPHTKQEGTPATRQKPKRDNQPVRESGLSNTDIFNFL
ncbi:type IV secretory system conjugative DNA transfer family protein [Eubacterium oxidoreducens]|uniref:Type IV secretory pathway, VirD4 component, TraG/TraD family ATPase n=1 Tax=Eubacterium oxidoreducens TaxID=1732 RepID=A0A1G6B3P6_EUBOX|nr:type IV secretory system conjugative DNA transfer family protein [Eubacterium oxidoreducens]SDB15300.1 Type IV secretory pathway, VirD4 component, TraG/TraD family ATPase [Eubacterium oxidoreducens]